MLPGSAISRRVVGCLLLLLLQSPDSIAQTIEDKVCHKFIAIRASADAGNAQAQSTLSKIFYEGYCGKPKADTEALFWAAKSAHAGNSSGESMMSVLLTQGEGIPQDFDQAYKWARLSAQQGDVPGESYLAVMLHHGWGTTKDDNEAMKWARKAAESNNAQAEGLIALLLVESGDKQQDEQAASWALAAASQGHTASQSLLARLYASGRGVKKDVVEADKWLIICERSHIKPYSDPFKEKLESGMSEAELISAKAHANAWKPTPRS